MAALFQVKVRFFAAIFLGISGFARSEEGPDAAAILRTVRASLGAQERSLNGRLRSGARAMPFKLSVAENTMRWEFSDPPQTLLLRLGEKDVRLEEISAGSAQKGAVVRSDAKVRDSDISYEDLSMPFLYWSKATVEGEQTMLLQKCWIVRVEPPAKSDSQYSAVKLWIAKNNGALLQAEALGADGRLARRFKVISGQVFGDGLWILRQMRIEAPTTVGGRTQDRTPTYLEIDAPER